MAAIILRRVEILKYLVGVVPREFALVVSGRTCIVLSGGTAVSEIQGKMDRPQPGTRG